MTLKAFSKVVSENIIAIYEDKLLFGQPWNLPEWHCAGGINSAGFLKFNPCFEIRSA